MLIFSVIIHGCSSDEKNNAENIICKYESSELLETDVFQDQRELKWIAGANIKGNSEIFRVIIFKYYANPNKKYLKKENGVLFYAGDSQPELIGDASVLSNNEIGLEINGSEQKLKPGLNVVLISNIQKLTQFIIPPTQVKLFMDELQKGDIYKFFDSRIAPYLLKNNKDDY